MTQDEKKTRAQLIEELVMLRKRVGEQEARGPVPGGRDELFRGISESVPTSIVIVDREGRVADISSHHIAHIGRGRTSKDHHIGTILHERPSVVGAGLSEDYRGVLSGIAFRKAEVRFPRTTGGREVFFDVSGEPLMEDGRVSGAVFVHQDVTQRKLAEEALRESENRHRAVSELTSDYAYCFRVEADGDLVIEWVTGALDRLTGYSQEELSDAGGWERLIHPDDLAIPMGQLEGLLANEERTVEYRILNKDGRIRWMLDHARPVWDSEERRVTHLEGAVRDISDIKQAEEERLDLQLRVQQAQKLESLETLAGGVAHDFNNLLVGVLGHAELALSSLPQSSPARGDIESARQAARLAAELANQMLAYSGKGRFVTEAVSLSEVAAGMNHLFQASLPKTTVLTFSLDDEIPLIKADKAQVGQVVLNFVTNASEALESRDGVVRVTTGTVECDRACLAQMEIDSDCVEGTYAFLEVADNGIGMAEETLATIFDPFFSTKFTGRGLGLAAVFGIVRGHGGGIKVESEPGRGTTIRALFPVSDQEAEAPETDDDDDQELATAPLGNTILLIDDEPAVLEVGARMLATAGFQVRTAKDGFDAVEVFKEHADDIGCVVLDLTMPKMDGGETFIELQKIRDDVPVLLCSGFTVEDVGTRMSLGGFAGFLKKPYSMKQLLKDVRKALEAR